MRVTKAGVLLLAAAWIVPLSLLVITPTAAPESVAGR